MKPNVRCTGLPTAGLSVTGRESTRRYVTLCPKCLLML